MRKKFYFHTKKKKKGKCVFLFLLFVLSIYITFQYLEQSKIKIDQKELVEILLSPNEETSILKEVVNILFPTKKEAVKTLIKANYRGLVINQEKTNPTVRLNKESSPLIYIYNSHQTEEYTPSSFVEYSVMPTVQMNNYILEEKFEEKNYQTMVEEQSIKQILNEHGWNYAGSYDASRLLLEQAKNNYPSLKYFIDVHRDSLPKERTTVTIDNKNYASILFLIGLENPSYQENLSFTEKINEKLNEKYPSLSKGIYKKEGEGVNGVYNQDFSPYTILVEMGGPDNTIDEVLNTSLAFAECFLEVISENEL